MNQNQLSNRKFKLWYYHVNHKEVLIRSMKDSCFENNIDLYFGDVDYIEIPSVLTDLVVEEANEKDVKYLRKKLNKNVSQSNIKVIISHQRRFYIVAEVFKIMENTLDIMQVPFPVFIKGINV